MVSAGCTEFQLPSRQQNAGPLYSTPEETHDASQLPARLCEGRLAMTDVSRSSSKESPTRAGFRPTLYCFRALEKGEFRLDQLTSEMQSTTSCLQLPFHEANQLYLSHMFLLRRVPFVVRALTSTRRPVSAKHHPGHGHYAS